MMEGKDKKQRVERMFDDIAPTYDALNHLLSLGIDRLWRRRVVRIAAGSKLNDSALSPVKILDVATGTGDLAIALARKIPAAQVLGVDISENMLATGREKVARAGFGDGRIVLQTGDAEHLEFADGAFDLVTVAFGIRNFGDIEAGLREMRRVLRRGGKCMVLEFSEPKCTIFAAVYRLYFHRILPLVGRLVSRDSEAYSYLPSSVNGFPAPARFAEMMREAGFFNIKTHKLTFGVSYIYEAES